jgi:hypothetical protein
MFVIANPNYTILVLVIHNYREYSNRIQNPSFRVEEGKGTGSEHNDKSAIAEGEKRAIYTRYTASQPSSSSSTSSSSSPRLLLLHPAHHGKTTYIQTNHAHVSSTRSSSSPTQRSILLYTPRQAKPSHTFDFPIYGKNEDTRPDPNLPPIQPNTPQQRQALKPRKKSNDHSPLSMTSSNHLVTSSTNCCMTLPLSCHACSLPGPFPSSPLPNTTLSTSANPIAFSSPPNSRPCLRLASAHCSTQ